MLTLLTNDDGIYAPGLAAMERVLRRLTPLLLILYALVLSLVGFDLVMSLDVRFVRG